MANPSKIDKQQRSAERFAVAMPVAFKNDNRSLEGEVANLGAGGMCIQTQDVLPVDSQMFFRLVAPSGMQFNVEALVVWSQPRSKIRQRRRKRPGMMGLKFVTSRFMTALAIQEIVQTFQPVTAN